MERYQNRYKPNQYFYNRVYNRSPRRNQYRETARNQNNPTEEQQKAAPINNKERGTKLTDWGLLFVTAVLAWYTYRLYDESRNQRAVTQQAANAAIQAVEQAREANRIAEQNFNQSQLSFKSNNEDADRRFKMESNSVRETQNRFEKEYEPYLQIKEASYGIDQPTKTAVLYFSIENLGKYVVKVLDSKIVMTTRVVPPPFKEAIKNAGKIALEVNTYISNNSKTPQHEIHFQLTEGQYKLGLTPNRNYYFAGYIKYQNLVTKKKKTYNFMIMMTDQENFVFIENDNVDSKPVKKRKIIS